jgi:hypothetical protein
MAIQIKESVQTGVTDVAVEAGAVYAGIRVYQMDLTGSQIGNLATGLGAWAGSKILLGAVVGTRGVVEI